MENQNKFLTPRLLHKENHYSENKNNEQDDFFHKLNAYTDVHQMKKKSTYNQALNDEIVDINLVSSIYDTPKVKIGEFLIDNRNLKFKKHFSKSTKLKHNKSQQNAFCERLSAPKTKKRVIDPQFVYKQPKKSNEISEYNKEFINSRFVGVDEIITLNQLESILADFTIIDHSVKEKPLISQNIFPLCQINEANDSNTFNSQMLKEALIQSFNKSADCAFWKEISNCIKSARMNRKKKSSLAPNALKKVHLKNTDLHNSEKKASLNDKQQLNNINVENHSCSNSSANNNNSNPELETINMNQNNSNDQNVFEEEQVAQINEEAKEYKFKLIADHFSETMIDLESNSEAISTKTEKDTSNEQAVAGEMQSEESKNKNSDVLNNNNKPENVCELSKKANNENKKKEENFTEEDYNSDSSDTCNDKNIGIDDLIKEIENNSHDHNLQVDTNNSSNKEIFDFNSYYSLEFESENENNAAKIISQNGKDDLKNFKNDCPSFSKLYDTLLLKKNESKESKLSIQAKENPFQG